MNENKNKNKKELNENEKIDKIYFNSLPTKSSKIRYLNSYGWKRGEIAKYLNIRYQHVRNVLITPIKNERK